MTIIIIIITIVQLDRDRVVPMRGNMTKLEKIDCRPEL